MTDAMPLYPSEKEIARAVLGERYKNWPSVAALDERKGLPKIDPVHGGRYWPAVCQFYDSLNGVRPDAADAPPSPRNIRIVSPMAPDGEEDFEAIRGRRRNRLRPPVRPA